MEVMLEIFKESWNIIEPHGYAPRCDVSYAGIVIETAMKKTFSQRVGRHTHITQKENVFPP